MRAWIEEALRLQMPFFGHDDTYFLGTGAVGASGNTAGEWSFAIGPDYTSPNYLREESIFMAAPSVAGKIPFEMHRLRGCGAFFGMAMFGGARITVTDAALPGSLGLMRIVTFENITGEELNFHAAADVTPDGGAVPVDHGIEIVKRAGDWCFGNQETANWAERRMRVTVPGSRALRHGAGWRLERSISLPVGGIAVLGVRHDFAYGDGYASVLEEKEYLEKSVAAWREWLALGEYPKGIGNARLRDAVECLLLNVRMQQNRDGGMIAGIRKYANSYIRDTHGGMRLLNACGHTAETGRLLRNIHTRWEKAGFIPNWWSMGSDTFIGNSFHNDASEITAYYIFMARDYLKHGGADALVAEIMPSLRFAAQSQADFLEKHGLLMDFNGDETEQYCVLNDGEEYGLFGHYGAKDTLGFDKTADSFASTAAAAQSLIWLGEYIGEEKWVLLANKVKARLEEAFWNEKDGRHGWIRDKDGLRGTYITNYSLLPVWLDIDLTEGREAADALAAVKDRSAVTGYLPNCPGIMDGFCGHTPGMALYDMTMLERVEAEEMADLILHSNLLGRYGTVSEFYGPGGRPNGHNCRPFEGGIVGEALVAYAIWKEKRKGD